MAAESRNLEIFKYLFDKGDDIHAKDKIHANDIISTIFHDFLPPFHQIIESISPEISLS